MTAHAYTQLRAYKHKQKEKGLNGHAPKQQTGTCIWEFYFVNAQE